MPFPLPASPAPTTQVQIQRLWAGIQDESLLRCRCGYYKIIQHRPWFSGGSTYPSGLMTPENRNVNALKLRRDLALQFEEFLIGSTSKDSNSKIFHTIEIHWEKICPLKDCPKVFFILFAYLNFSYSFIKIPSTFCHFPALFLLGLVFGLYSKRQVWPRWTSSIWKKLKLGTRCKRVILG